MKKLITLILLASFVLIGACSKKGYNNNLISRNSGNYSDFGSDTNTQVESISYNTTWSGFSSSLTTTDNDKRAIANFYGYNTFHYAKKELTLSGFPPVPSYKGFYGYKSETSYSGEYFNSNDHLRNYFNYDDISGSSLKASAAPKDIGTVYDAAVIFKANIDEATGDILTDNAYLYVEFRTSSKTLKVSFSNLDSMTLNSNDLEAKFSDGCGSVVLEANLVSNGSSYDLEDVHVSYLNNSSSYKDSSCYYNTPSGPVWGLAKMSTFPDRLPDGLGNASMYTLIDSSDFIILEQE
jgi:hypothetical protein